jgi:hypothetical protein
MPYDGPYEQVRYPDKNIRRDHVYSTSIEVPFSPNYVFNHAIDLSKWWPEEYIGENIEPGTEFIFKTGEGHYSKNKIVEFDPDKKIVWLTTGSLRKADNYDWTGTKFIFELIPKGKNTLVKFKNNNSIKQESH